MFTWGSSHRGGRHAARTILLSSSLFAMMACFALPARAGDIPKPKTQAMPAYPQAAKSMKVSGEVYVEAVVTAQGTVKQVRPVFGNLILSKAVTDAVSQWKFAPSANEHVVVAAFNFVNP